MIYAFNHPHKPGDICSKTTCEAARRAPTLAGSEVFDDLPMRIVREATEQQYLDQPLPDDWCLPEVVYECGTFYEIEVLD